MGGALILVSIALSTLVWSDLSNHYVWVTLLVTMLYGAIGWVDDYRKVFRKNTAGLSARWKLFWQTAIGLGAAISLYYTALSAVETSYIVPFFKDVSIDVGILYIAVSCFIIVGFSNAVNLTDGLDGLAILPTVMVGGALGVIAYLAGHTELSAYLNIPYVVGSGEVVFSQELYWALVLGSYGLTHTPHRFSWETLGRWRSVLHSLLWRSSRVTR